MSSNSVCKLWGGRFSCEISDTLMALNCSLPVDKRLFAQDLDGSRAYAKCLLKAGIITENECEIILMNLELIRYDWIENLIEFLPTDEDVHSVNERRLVEMCGEIGKKLHTGRSRNDQVITDFKLWMKKAIQETLLWIKRAVEVIVNVSEKHTTIIFPGYTHLQRAQPVLFSHWLLSHAFSLKEDCSRLQSLLNRVDVLPLGSGAIAGNPLGVDRSFLAKELGFSRCTDNSMHTVGDRDFVVEFNFCCSLTSLHLTKLAEDLILYSSKEFNFVRVSDEFSTGSSLMPQKRNPDSLELIRGMSGNIFGEMTGFMMTIKGLPSTYNKDLQFDKKAAFNCYDALKSSLCLMEGVIGSISINETECYKALSSDMLATDWAYYLVKKGVPFRSAHHLIGKVVSLAEKRKVKITELSLKELKEVSKDFGEDVKAISSFQGSIEQYKSLGGTSTDSVERQITELREFVAIKNQ